MFQRDYLLRMIQMLSRALARVLRQKDLNSTENALREIDEAGKMYAGMGSATIAQYADEDLIALAHSGGGFDTNKCLAIHELLYAEGTILFLREDETGYRLRFQRALHFLLEALLEDEDLDHASYDRRIAELRSRLSDVRLPYAIGKKLFAYFEKNGEYGLAEDVLFDLSESDPGLIRVDGMLFYQRLLKKADDDLMRGNLPRPEVEEGLQEFLRRTPQNS